MSFRYPVLLALAVVVAVALVLLYRRLQRQQPAMLRRRFRRHVPPLVFLVALVFLLVGAARPQATVKVPRVSGTVILAFDVSNSMAAKDVTPSRLAAAQAAATSFVRAQPNTVDIGVVAFGQGALTTQLPTADHEATIGAIKRLQVAGGTSLGQAILGSLTAITGKPVTLPEPNSGAPAPDLGYWRSATIVLLSDGEDTGGPDAVAAAELASSAGVHIETIGVGTVDGATIEVDGFQIATALNEDLLREMAESTAGSYHRAEDAQDLGNIYRSLDLRITTKEQPVELTGVAVTIAVLLLTIGGLLMITWFGRIL
jgi:Ca-activated chloride channel family protein